MSDVAAFDWGLARRQTWGILRLELGKNLLSRRALALYFLAFAPALPVFTWSLTGIPREAFGNPAAAIATYANFFPIYLRASVFLSAIFIFTNLFRAEILEKNLHYYLLAPVRREVLVAGKYLSALLATSAVFALGTALLFIFAAWPWGLSELARYLFSGPGLGHLLGYMGVAVLACAGYGALFLLAGLLFRNPVIPAVFLLSWESINFILPSLLKKLSVIHYLQSLYPIPVNLGPFAVVAEPTPAWVAIPGMLVFTAAVLAASCWKARKMEISYGGD